MVYLGYNYLTGLQFWALQLIVLVPQTIKEREHTTNIALQKVKLKHGLMTLAAYKTKAVLLSGWKIVTVIGTKIKSKRFIKYL